MTLPQTSESAAILLDNNALGRDVSRADLESAVHTYVVTRQVMDELEQSIAYLNSAAHVSSSSGRCAEDLAAIHEYFTGRPRQVIDIPTDETVTSLHTLAPKVMSIAYVNSRAEEEYLVRKEDILALRDSICGEFEAEHEAILHRRPDPEFSEWYGSKVRGFLRNCVWHRNGRLPQSNHETDVNLATAYLRLPELFPGHTNYEILSSDSDVHSTIRLAQTAQKRQDA